MHGRRSRISRALLALGAALAAGHGSAQLAEEQKLAEAGVVLNALLAEGRSGMPSALLQQAHGLAVIPNVIRGGFFIGGRRGKGVVAVRSPNGEWSNPAFVTLTGGSIGWQIGAESLDIVLLFASERAIDAIAGGTFTVGGDISATAGPASSHTAAARTWRSEIYAYARSRGLFAGAAFEGAKIGIDDAANYRLYGATEPALQPQSVETPAAARRFLLAVQRAELRPSDGGTPDSATDPSRTEEARTYPLGGAP